MILSLSILGIFLSVILLYFNARKFPATIYLGLFFLLISLYNFIQFVMLYSKSVFLVSVVFLNFGFLSYLIGPMFYWYVRSVLTDNSRLKKSDLWHLLPMAIFFLSSLPHLFTPWANKLEIASKIVEDNNYIWFYQPTIFAKHFSAFIIFISRPVLVFCYTIWSVVLFIRFKRIKGESNVFTKQYFMSKWLIGLFAFVTIWFVSHALQIVEAAFSGTLNIFYSLNILQFLSAAGLIGLLVLPFFFPAILYGLPMFPQPTTLLTNQDEPSGIKPGKPDGPTTGTGIKVENKYEADYLMNMHQNIELCMKNLKPYIQPDCNLAYLSKLIDVPMHHVAYYFREEKKQTFNDYRNGWRIGHAKILIIEGKANELTLEAIGLLSGFSTRNTFFISFKKVEGISPGEFLARHTL